MSDNTEENSVQSAETQVSASDPSTGAAVAQAATEANPVAAGEPTATGNRRPRNHPEMRIFHNIKPDEQTGAIVNPRRENTFGYNAMQILINAGETGLTYREYVKGGGRPNDLDWDMKRGHVRVVQPTDDPETAARMKEEADKIAAEKAAAKAVKAEEAATKKAEREKAAEEKNKAKAEADAAKAKAKAEAEEAKKAAEAAATAGGQVNGTSSVENANAADESRLAAEAGEGPKPTGDAPTTANAKGKGKGGAGKTGSTNVESSIPV